jgi:hypothetical protein
MFSTILWCHCRLPNSEGQTPRALACNAGFYDCARFITERPLLCKQNLNTFPCYNSTLFSNIQCIIDQPWTVVCVVVLGLVKRTKRLLDKTAFEMKGDRQHKMLAVTSNNTDNSDLSYTDSDEEVNMDTQSEVYL